MVWPAVIGAAAVLGSSLLSSHSASKANQANQAMSKEQMEWSSKEAAIARQFDSTFNPEKYTMGGKTNMVYLFLLFLIRHKKRMS